MSKIAITIYLTYDADNDDGAGSLCLPIGWSLCIEKQNQFETPGMPTTRQYTYATD